LKQIQWTALINFFRLIHQTKIYLSPLSLIKAIKEFRITHTLVITREASLTALLILN
jgi:hypothetical protein